MDVYIEREDRTETLSFSGSAEDLLGELDINPQTVLVLKNDVLVTEDEELSDEDSVRVLTVVSGG